MSCYKILEKNVYCDGKYSIVPIRLEDCYDIMQWRNEQIYHLRQNKMLSKEDQDKYFADVVNGLFSQEHPSQVLFSYLKDEKCLGYGGLVHLNWSDKNAEISFLMDTKIEENEFEKHWSIYLGLIERVAFGELKLHKIYTYAFDIRPHLYTALKHNAYTCEARLKEHCFCKDVFKDVVIHSKIDLKITLRAAVADDLDITYQWASDPLIRKYALTSHAITFAEHSQWFSQKIDDSNCLFLIAEVEDLPIGSIRFDICGKEATISYLICTDMQGKGFGKRMLHEGLKRLFNQTDVHVVKGMVLKNNIVSAKLFQSLGFEQFELNQEQSLYSRPVYDKNR